ncbi:MAG: serine/threonine protein kinase, partial [Gammaproteobacteria bacterium]|nr:serine/threonine protein kinase [Gammaproteobacteria bacterium]
MVGERDTTVDEQIDGKPYGGLTPDTILDAIDALGFVTTGATLALNSYENRVYQVGIESDSGHGTDTAVVVKFYRPGRWSDAAIQEEHAFSLELVAKEVPVIAPLQIDETTLHDIDSFRYAVFPRRGGRWPNLENKRNRQWLGRFLGRIHACGGVREFRFREALNVDQRGWESVNFINENNWIPTHLKPAYDSLTDDLLVIVEELIQGYQSAAGGWIRLHGDCHPGNILWTDDGPHFVDLDDCVMGPAIQDLWMLLSGSREEMSEQMADILEGYAQFADFDHRQLGLIEPLRTLRMIHYSAWLARRWQDPAFPRAFPWFAESRYWEEHILALREQLALLQEPALEL